jgi:hypothetical protein
MDLDIFLQEQNIRRYRKLLDASMGETERRTILKLLAEEMKKIKGSASSDRGRSASSLN